LKRRYLIVSKLAAGRLKDLEFAAALFLKHLADPAVVRRRIRLFPEMHRRERLSARLRSVLDDLD
jgi:hypothetical protein